MSKEKICGFGKFSITVCTAVLVLGKTASAQSPISLDIISTLNYIQDLLSHIGPMLSAILFIVAGIFYAIGQLFPSHQRGTFQATASDLIIGAIIVGVLSVASNSFAIASTHLLSNITISNVT